MKDIRDGFHTRTAALIGGEALEILRNSHIIIIGIGGVGSYCAEAIARCGVGAVTLIDPDVVCESNVNRQIHATVSTLGCHKTEAMRRRILDINPNAAVEAKNIFYSAETRGEVPFIADYVIDAVDSVASKVCIACEAKKNGVPVVSVMGAGNKLDPSRFRVADIYETSVCPLAKAVRRELRKNGIDSLDVIFSDETPRAMQNGVLGSVSFVPAAAGLLAASHVVRRIIESVRPS